MICPKCGHPKLLRKGGDSQNRMAKMDAALNQRRHILTCARCSHEVRTIEIEQAEMARLRGMAHRLVMLGEQ